MASLAERFLLLTPAGVAGLRGLDLLRRGLHRPSTSFFRFVPEQSMEGSSGGIKDAAVQALLVLTAGCGHVLDIQRL